VKASASAVRRDRSAGANCNRPAASSGARKRRHVRALQHEANPQGDRHLANSMWWAACSAGIRMGCASRTRASSSTNGRVGIWVRHRLPLLQNVRSGYLLAKRARVSGVTWSEGLLSLVAIGDKARQHVDQEVRWTPVATMFDLRDVFQLLICRHLATARVSACAGTCPLVSSAQV
jgi:hypothetical protein